MSATIVIMMPGIGIVAMEFYVAAAIPIVSIASVLVVTVVLITAMLMIPILIAAVSIAVVIIAMMIVVPLIVAMVVTVMIVTAMIDPVAIEFPVTCMRIAIVKCRSGRGGGRNHPMMSAMHSFAVAER